MRLESQPDGVATPLTREEIGDYLVMLIGAIDRDGERILTTGDIPLLLRAVALVSEKEPA